MLRAVVRTSKLRPSQHLCIMFTGQAHTAAEGPLNQTARSSSKNLRNIIKPTQPCCSFARQREPNMRWEPQLGRKSQLQALQTIPYIGKRSIKTLASASRPIESAIQSDSSRSLDSLRCILPEIAEDLADSFGDTLLCFGASAVRCTSSFLRVEPLLLTIYIHPLPIKSHTRRSLHTLASSYRRLHNLNRPAAARVEGLQSAQARVLIVLKIRR